jgi:hypothetical protein
MYTASEFKKNIVLDPYHGLTDPDPAPDPALDPLSGSGRHKNLTILWIRIWILIRIQNTEKTSVFLFPTFIENY